MAACTHRGAEQRKHSSRRAKLVLPQEHSQSPATSLPSQLQLHGLCACYIQAWVWPGALLIPDTNRIASKRMGHRDQKQQQQQQQQ